MQGKISFPLPDMEISVALLTLYMPDFQRTTSKISLFLSYTVFLHFLFQDVSECLFCSWDTICGPGLYKKSTQDSRSVLLLLINALGVCICLHFLSVVYLMLC